MVCKAWCDVAGNLRCYDGNVTTTVKTKSFIEMVVKKLVVYYYK